MRFSLLSTSINHTPESTMFHIPKGRRIIHFPLLSTNIRQHPPDRKIHYIPYP